MAKTPRWRRSMGTTDVDQDVKNEVEFHLDMQIRDLMGEGMTREEAEAEALRRFGDVGRVEGTLLKLDRRRQREVRRSQVLDNTVEDVRFGVRQLVRRPALAVVAVAILGLGIGANAAVFRVVDGALLRPLPMPREHELVYVTDVQNEESGYPSSWPEYEDWRRDGSSVFASLAAFASNSYTVQHASGPESVIAGLVAGEFQETLGLPPVIGRSFDEAERASDSHVVMLSERTWRDRFNGDTRVIGQTLVVDGEQHTIIGVMPTAADLLVNRRELSFWMPMFLPERLRDRGFHLLVVTGRLHNGLTLDEARTRAAVLAQGLSESGATRHGLRLEPVREVLIGDARTLLLTLFGAVLLLLLIVCANLANLFLLQSSRRSREFAIRTALGAVRMRLVRQLLTEMVLLGLVGGVVGLLISRGAVHLVARISGQAGSLAAQSSFDVRVIVFTAIWSIGTAMLFGLLPALRASRQDVVVTLRQSDSNRGGTHRSQRRGRNILVGAELALSVVLIASAALMVKSVWLLLREDPGFRAENVLAVTVALSPERYDESKQLNFFLELLQRVNALPGVQLAAAVSHLPLDGGDTNGSFEIVGREYPPGEGPYSKKRIATPGYFSALGIPHLRGRDFDERDDAAGRQVVIISEAIAQRYWPGEDPLGREIDFGWGPGDRHEIIGVVGDVKHDGLDIEIEGAIYRPLTQFPRPGMTLVTRAAADPLAIAGAVRHVVTSLDPEQPIRSMTTMSSVVVESIAPRRTLMVLLSLFAAIALLISVMGVYTVTAQSASQRRHEIGVRMAIGAQRADVLRLVMREELTVVALGVIAGLIGASVATRSLQASLYGVSTTDPATFASVAGLLVLVALVASYLPARRAARSDPVTALRTD